MDKQQQQQEDSAESVRSTVLGALDAVTAQLSRYCAELDAALAPPPGAPAAATRVSPSAVRALLDAARALVGAPCPPSLCKAGWVELTAGLGEALKRVAQDALRRTDDASVLVRTAARGPPKPLEQRISYAQRRLAVFPSLMASAYASGAGALAHSPTLSPTANSPTLAPSAAPPCDSKGHTVLRPCGATQAPAGTRRAAAAIQAAFEVYQNSIKPYEEDASITREEFLRAQQLAQDIPPPPPPASTAAEAPGTPAAAQPSPSQTPQASPPPTTKTAAAGSQQQQPAVCGLVLAEGFRAEIGSKSLAAPPRPMLVSDPDHFEQQYAKYFFGNDHWNYVGSDGKDGPCALSMIVQRREASAVKAAGESVVLRALLRTKRGEQLLEFAVDTKKRGAEFGAAEALRAFKKQYVACAAYQLEHVARTDLELALCDYEEKHHTTKFKFGVLYATGGQGGVEDDMYSNEKGSALFDAFLRLLGTYIPLRGWDKYRGGLDTSDNGATGEHSVYTDWRGFEIMFHVSTLLPYTRGTAQQVERKRHIGNDIVVLVFHTGQGNFDPSCFRSHFNHVFVVVRPVFVQAATGDDHYHYRVSVILRGEVKLFPPHFPRDYLFPPGELFREFILTKLMNAELASLKSPQFAQRMAGVRRNMLETIVKKYAVDTDKKP